MTPESKGVRHSSGWVVLRVLLLIGIIPASRSTSGEPTTSQLVILFVGGLVICGAAVLWVYFSDDESYRESVRDLFWFTPIWPPWRFACALWIFLGMLIVVGSVADIIEGAVTHYAISSALITLVIGIVLIGSNIAIYRKKRVDAFH